MAGRTHDRARGRWPAAAGRTGWALLGLAAGVGATLLVLQLMPGPVTDRETGELVILSGADDSAGRVRNQLIAQWNREHPDHPARIHALSSQADQQQSEVLAAAQSGRGEYDIYNLDVTWVPQFASAHYIQPLRRPDTRGFLEKPLRTGKYQGEQWALPFNTDAGLLFYRTDLFGKARPLPTELPPSQQYTAELLRGSPGRFVAGYTGQLRDDYEGMTVNAMEAVWSARGQVVGDDGVVEIDSRETRRGFKRLADALHGRSRAALPEQDETTSTREFVEGRVPLMRNWPVQYDTIVDPTERSPAGSATPTPSTAAGTVDVRTHFAVAELPGPSVLGGQDLAVAADSDSPRAAQELIEFLTSETSQATLFADGGFAAVRAHTYDDTKVLGRRPYARTLLHAVENAKLRPVTAHYTLFSAAFRTVVQYALSNDGELAPDAAATLTAALRGQQ